MLVNLLPRALGLIEFPMKESPPIIKRLKTPALSLKASDMPAIDILGL